MRTWRHNSTPAHTSPCDIGNLLKMQNYKKNLTPAIAAHAPLPLLHFVLEAAAPIRFKIHHGSSRFNTVHHVESCRIEVNLHRQNTKGSSLAVAPFCDPHRIQTCNLLIRSQMLYSVELADPKIHSEIYFLFALQSYNDFSYRARLLLKKKISILTTN